MKTKREFLKELLETYPPVMAEARLGYEYYCYQLDQGIEETETDHFKSRTPILHCNRPSIDTL